MSSKSRTNKSTENFSNKIERLYTAIQNADAILIGAGAGLSTSAGLTYSGRRFEEHFADFIEKYHIPDMYSGGFYPFTDPEEYWAWWSRHIYWNRYVDAPNPVYPALRRLVEGRDYFVLTTNVDHQFQRAGFDKKRLFYTQGDYGLFQCSEPCCRETYDNETVIRQMLARQKDMRIPSELLPVCPHCGKPMTMNLRSDDRFVEDEGWQRAAERYEDFVWSNQNRRILLMELGVGCNTPGIIKYPFWQMAAENPKAVYACVNYGEAACPKEIADRSIVVNADIGDVVSALLGEADCSDELNPSTENKMQ